MRKTKLTAYVLAEIDVSMVPEEIRILPLGHVTSSKGDFEVDDESCESIIRQFKSRKLDLVIDYEHQTLENKQAPAAGWIKDLYQGTDALMAVVEWTKKAKQYLANKEYRYLSPVVLARRSDNKAVILHSGALTNTPAIDGMFAIINSDDLIIGEERGEQFMELAKILELLGLPETATEEEVSEKLNELASRAGKETEVVANKTVLDLLGLTKEAKTEDVTAKIMSFKAGGAEVTARLAELEKESKGRKADELVTKALKDGKISADQKDWALNYAMSDADGFEQFAAKAPAVVPVGRMTYACDPVKSTDVDMVVCRNIGVSQEDIKRYLGGSEDE